MTKDLRHLTVGWRAVLVPSRPPVQLLRVPGWAQQTREEQVEQVTCWEVVEGLVQVAVQAVVLLVVFEVGVAGGHQMSRPRCRDGRKLGCGGRRASRLKEEGEAEGNEEGEGEEQGKMCKGIKGGTGTK